MAAGDPVSLSILCTRCGFEQTGPDALPLCERCGVAVRGALLSVDELLALLDDAAAGLDRVESDGRGSDDDVRRTLDARFPLTAAATSSPVDFGATEARRTLVAVVDRWSRRLLEALAAPCGHGTCFGAMLPRCAAADRRVDALRGFRNRSAWLADRWQAIRRQTFAPELAGDVLAAVGRGQALVDAPPETYFVGACGAELEDPDLPGYVYACGWELRARLGDLEATCRGCGTTHDVAVRRSDLLAGVGDRLVTAVDAARALSTPERPVTAAMVRGWRFRGHLEQAEEPDEHGERRPAVTPDGKPLYRLRDVVDVDNRLRYGTTTGKTS